MFKHLTVALTAVALAGLIALLVVGCKTDFEKQTERWEECMSTEQITYEQALEVRNKNRPIIRRQPNYVGSGVYLIDVGDGVEAMGIIVYVSEIVDQSTLPEADRIGDCLEGIPVLFHLRGPLKLLGGPATGTTTTAIPTAFARACTSARTRTVTAGPSRR